MRDKLLYYLSVETVLVLYIIGRDAGSSTVHGEIIVARMAAMVARTCIIVTLLLHCKYCSFQIKYGSHLTYILGKVSEHRTLGVFPNLIA